MTIQDSSGDQYVRRAELEAARNGRTFQIDSDCYEVNGHYISLLMSNFMVRHLIRLNRVLDGDFVAGIVLGEIAHHNLSGTFIRHGVVSAEAAIANAGELSGTLRPCNVLSISESTGIPRESVRRRVESFLGRGWLRREDGGGLVITSTTAETFMSNFNVVMVRDFLATAELLKKSLTPPPEASSSVSPLAPQMPM